MRDGAAGDGLFRSPASGIVTRPRRWRRSRRCCRRIPCRGTASKRSAGTAPTTIRRSSSPTGRTPRVSPSGVRPAALMRGGADPARETETLGRFMEVVVPPMDRLEVAYSPPHLPQGAGNLQSRVSACPVAEHAYWGSARDRIPASQTDPLESSASTLVLTRLGTRVRVEPGDNVCMIRSGQDWSDTTGEERATYLGRVQPRLIDGMTYLRDEGLPIGCFSCRYMQVLDGSGTVTEKTFGQAYSRASCPGTLGGASSHAPRHLRHVHARDGAARRRHAAAALA